MPKAFLSYSGGAWRVIYAGVPVSADKRSRAEALAAARKLRVVVESGPVWNGDRGCWVGENSFAEET